MKRLALLGLLFLSVGGCDRKQVTDVAVGAGTDLGHAYLTSQRDQNIRNYQRRVADTPACASFKKRFKAAGERYDSNASAQYAGDMMKVMDAVKAAGCEYQP